MDITLVEQKDNFARIDVTVEKSDYAADYKKRLNNISTNASMRGFRKGHVPKGLILKMYGDSIHVDAVSEAVTTKLMDFIREKELKTIGQPIMPKELNQGEKLLQDEMTLTFHLALIPTISEDILGSDDQLTYYQPIINEEEVTKQLERLQQTNSKFVEGDHIVPNAFISGTLAELDGDTPKEGGIQVERTIVYPDFMTDEEEKAKFDNAPKNSIVVFNPYKAYGGKKSELKALFRLDDMSDEEVEKYKESDFSYEIKEISYSKRAELDQEFFDTVFGPDKVHSEEEAREELKSRMEQNIKANADYKFTEDLIDLIANKKTEKVELAEDTIIEWYKGSEMAKDQSDEEIDSNLKELMKGLKLDIVINHYTEKYGLEVTEDDLSNFTRSYVINQLAQIGLTSPTEDMIEGQVQRALSNDNFRYNTQQNMLRQMVAQKIHEEGLLTVDTKEVTPNELQKIITAGDEKTEEEAAE
ncbi:MAG: trigger factor [Porphyromonas sp.]|uniref:trigger factor n=1 Tax=Porphyromonas sp. TaxID=1924944 RepID=UPI002A91B5EC|nr:trigger factor [Porphyromonas sp.]MDD7469022.1 trigger factor [Bacteroidales bacterium]MDY6102511.1 trigger factor [Porphyromonas sp.]